MNLPTTLNFDLCSLPQPSDGAVHLPKIYQGAPYLLSFGMRPADSQDYRDFSIYDEIRMQIRRTQSADVLLTLTKTEGQIQTANSLFTFNIPAAMTASIAIPIYDPKSKITQMPFVFDIELMQSGAVVERAFQGTGFLVAATTRDAGDPA